ncbi:hypothetical protein [Longispora albida]|uniref:hypothetical protein n=1 Tax=Longispora albida TaxID=203523 RepID=UPI0003604CE8|nr:hypothetical protein [Longispora albida]
MKTAVFAFREPGPGWDELGAWISEVARTTTSPSGKVVLIELGEYHGYLVADEYDPELWQPGAFTGTPAVYAIDYRSHRLIEALVRHLVHRAPFVIDTNYGDELVAEDFLAKLDADPGWRWWAPSC